MNVAPFIDHTLLKPNSLVTDIERICEEAVQHGFPAICVPPYFVALAKSKLKQQTVAVATVAGFPLGYGPVPSKVETLKKCLDDGADELDVVINIAAAKNGHWSYLRNEIDSFARAVHMRGKIVKIILEVSLLSAEEIKRLCAICSAVGVDYAKTSTGFSGTPTTPEEVSFLKSHLDKNVKIKASGGIRTLQTVQDLIAAGASRIGTSSGIKIIESQS